MPAYTDVVTESHFRDLAAERFAKYGITNDDINVSIHQDAARSVDLLQVHIRPDSINKYGFEMGIDNAPADIVERSFQQQITRIEHEYLRSGECIVRYRNRTFFYSFEQGESDDELSMLLQCEMCDRMLRESIPEVLSDYRDVFLMLRLPDAERRCVCGR